MFKDKSLQNEIEIMITDASGSEADLDIVEADNSLLDAPWRQLFQEELKTIMNDISITAYTVKKFYEKVIGKYYNGSNDKLDINSDIESDTLVLPIVWNFLYENNKEKGNGDSTKFFTIKKIEEAIINELTCKDVAERWPQAKQRARKPSNQMKGQKNLKAYIEEHKEQLLDYLQKNGEVVDNDTIFNFFKRRSEATKILNKSQEQIDYDKALKQFTNLLKSFRLPNIQLSEYTQKISNMTLLNKNSQNSVFFGTPNTCIQYDDFDKITEEQKTMLTKYKWNFSNNTLSFDKNQQNKIDNFDALQIKDNQLTFFKLSDNKLVEIKDDTDTTNKKYNFIKEGKSLNKEQTFLVDKPLQNWLIFHDPGVGKTLNALAVAIKNLKDGGNIHVVAPSKSILAQWKDTLETWIKEDIYTNNITNITLTLQTQVMFNIVCSSAKKGSFYNFYNNETVSATKLVDDVTFNEIIVKDTTEWNFGPNFTKLLEKIDATFLINNSNSSETPLVTTFNDFFYNTDKEYSFLYDFLRSFWSYCFVFKNNKTIHIFANVVESTETEKEHGLGRPLTVKMFQPMNQSHQKDRDKGFDEFKKVTNDKLKNTIESCKEQDKYIDYGALKMIKINKQLDKFKWSTSNVMNNDVVSYNEYFPMLGEKTVLIIDESHNVVSSKLSKNVTRYISDVGRHCKQIICCTATPFNSADNLENQLYLYGCILNKDPVHYTIPSTTKEGKKNLLLAGMKLIRNKVSGKKKVTNVTEQADKINLILNRIPKESNDNETKNLLRESNALQDLLFKRLNYDFFNLFKSNDADYKKITTDEEPGLDNDKDKYVTLSRFKINKYEETGTAFVKKSILYNLFRHIYNIDDTANKQNLYPRFDEEVIMFKATNNAGHYGKRFPDPKNLDANDENVAFNAKYTKQNSIDENWKKDKKTWFCYPPQNKPRKTGNNGNEDDEDDDEYIPEDKTRSKNNNNKSTEKELTIFDKSGNISEDIFVPDLIVSKIRFMVEDALENIILYHKNVMIYSYTKDQNKYIQQVFRMYNVQKIKINVDNNKSVEENVKKTLLENNIFTKDEGKTSTEEKNERLTIGVTEQKVCDKFNLKWKYWNPNQDNATTLIEVTRKDLEQLGKMFDKDFNIKQKLNNYDLEKYKFGELPDRDEDKTKLWKQRILGTKKSLPYFITDPIDSAMDQKEREVVQELFNLGILDICLTSDAGAQGTDFKSTRESMMYVAYTGRIAVPANILQFKGRLNRKKSHSICPEEKRKVTFKRVCLSNNVRANRNKCDRLSRFFYYKVPKNGPAINYFYTDDFAQTKEIPEKCMFCNSIKENNPTKDCCKDTSAKTYYYLQKGNKFKNNDDSDTTECHEFRVYERFLLRLQKLNLFTLLMKTESAEHYKFAEAITPQKDKAKKEDVRFMAVKGKKYMYLKRICYNEQLDTRLQNQTTETVPEVLESEGDDESLLEVSVQKPVDNDFTNPFPNNDTVSKKKTGQKKKQQDSQKKTKKDSQKRTTEDSQKRTKEDLQNKDLIIIYNEVNGNVKKYLVKYFVDDNGEEFVQYMADITDAKNLEDSENIKYFVDTYTEEKWDGLFTFKSKKKVGEDDDWEMLNDFIELEIDNTFQFKDNFGDDKTYVITEIQSDYVFKYELKNMQSKPGILDLRKDFIKKNKKKSIKQNLTRAERAKRRDEIKEKQSPDRSGSGSSGDESNTNGNDSDAWTQKDSDDKEDDYLINEPVDSIVATYPYLSLE